MHGYGALTILVTSSNSGSPLDSSADQPISSLKYGQLQVSLGTPLAATMRQPPTPKLPEYSIEKTIVRLDASCRNTGRGWI